MADIQIQVGDVVVMLKSGNKAEIVRVGVAGCNLLFLDDIAFAKQHGLPRSQFEVWFPYGEFRKESGDEA